MYSDLFFPFRGNWRILFTITDWAMSSDLISVHVDRDVSPTSYQTFWGNRSKGTGSSRAFWHEDTSLEHSAETKVRWTRDVFRF